MSSAASLPHRVARGAVASAVCSMTATAAHTAAGGALEGLPLVGVLAVSMVIATSLAGQRITAVQFVGLLVLAQAGLHVVAGSSETAPGLGMLSVHLVATLVSAVLLTQGEQACWSLGTHLLRRILLVLVSPGPAAIAVRVVPSSSLRVRHAAAHALTRLERGPPVAAA